MNPPFDPYYTWLGIPPSEQPSHHYRLLGLQLYEANARVIENAADRQMRHLRSFQTGANSADSQRLLNEVAAARICLLDPEKKSAYDQQLASRLAPPPRPVANRPLPVAAPLPAAQALPPRPQLASSAVPPSGAGPGVSLNLGGGPAAGATSLRAGKKKSKGGDSPWGVIQAVLGGTGGLFLGVLVVSYFAGIDPLGLSKQSREGHKEDLAHKPPEKPQHATKKDVSKEVPSGPIHSTPARLDKVVGTSPKTTPPSTVDSDLNTIPLRPKTTGKEEMAPAKMPPTTVGSPKTMPATKSPADDNDQPSRPPRSGFEDLVKPKNRPAPAQRAPIPTAADQQAKLNQLKEIYKAEFDTSLKPANLESFRDFLVETSDTLRSDPAARYVLLNEAFKRSIGLKDPVGAAEVIDLLDASFAVDSYHLRINLLEKASLVAKTPVEKSAIVDFGLEMAEYGARQGLPEEAYKCAQIADGHAKSLGDAEVKAKAKTIALEMAKMAGEYAPVMRARETLVKTPEDPAANLVDGKYRCLQDGNWPDGVKELAQCGDAKLKAAALLDLDGQKNSAPAARVGDSWFELAKSSAAWTNFYARAHFWYARAVESAAGLEQVRIKQRLEQIAAMKLPPRCLGSGSNEEDQSKSLRSALVMLTRSETSAEAEVNLLPHIELDTATPNKGWSLVGDRLTTPPDARGAHVFTSYAGRRGAYRMSLRVSRGFAANTSGPIIVGLLQGGKPFALVIDQIENDRERVSYLTMAGKPTDNPTVRRNFGFQVIGAAEAVVCTVEPKRIEVQINGQTIVDYSGDMNKLALPADWGFVGVRSFFFGTDRAKVTLEQWSVMPLWRTAGGKSTAPIFGQDQKKSGFPAKP